MKQLIIIGAGGFGREVVGWAQQSAAFRTEWEIKGFLDDGSAGLDAFAGMRLPVLGTTIEYIPKKEDVFLCAIGNPVIRAQMRQRLGERGAVFTRLIHQSVVLGRNVQLDPGVILCPRVVLTCDLWIGENSALNVAVAVGHDAQIGADCQISSFCDITGHVRLGDAVFMGSGARILPGQTIGDGAVVGAGSVVIRNVPSGITVFGNPAKVLAHHR